MGQSLAILTLRVTLANAVSGPTEATSEALTRCTPDTPLPTGFSKLCPSSHAPSLSPPRERETLLTRRRAEAEHERIRGEQRRVAEAAVNLQPHPEEQTGFIPFYSE